MTTKSFAVLPGERTWLPEVMRTRPIRGLPLKDTPRNENVSLPAKLPAKNVPREVFAPSKNCNEVVFARSTSLNTTPKPVTNAGVVEPGTKKVTSVTLLPNAVNSRCGENGAKRVG